MWSYRIQPPNPNIVAYLQKWFPATMITMLDEAGLSGDAKEA